jgi:peptide subunit release factor RF-3
MLRTNLFVAIRASNATLAGEVDAALDQLRSEGAIRTFSEAQGLPALVP